MLLQKFTLKIVNLFNISDRFIDNRALALEGLFPEIMNAKMGLIMNSED